MYSLQSDSKLLIGVKTALYNYIKIFIKYVTLHTAALHATTEQLQYAK